MRIKTLRVIKNSKQMHEDSKEKFHAECRSINSQEVKRVKIKTTKLQDHLYLVLSCFC